MVLGSLPAQPWQLCPMLPVCWVCWTWKGCGLHLTGWRTLGLVPNLGEFNSITLWPAWMSQSNQINVLLYSCSQQGDIREVTTTNKQNQHEWQVMCRLQCMVHLWWAFFAMPNQKDVPLVGLMYLVFTCMPCESYHKQLGPLLLCLCDIFWVVITSLLCWFELKGPNLSEAASCVRSWYMPVRSWSMPDRLVLSVQRRHRIHRQTGPWHSCDYCLQLAVM